MSVTVEHLPPLPPRPWGGDGYDWMGELSESWPAIPSWGKDGWDLGSWPLVIVCTCAVAIPEADRPAAQPAVCVHCRQPIQPLDLSPEAKAFIDQSVRPEAYPRLNAAANGPVWVSDAVGGGADCPALAKPLPGAEWHPVHQPVRQTRAYGVATYVEGDIEVAAYATHEERIRAIDGIAAFYWRLDGTVPPIGPLAEDYTGPFSWERAGGSTA